MAGCATTQSTTPADCEAYGIRNTHARPARSFNALWAEQIEATCGKNKAGCAIERPDGTVDIYWQHGDDCAMRHELAHLICGPYHTVEYTQARIAGENMRRFCK